MDGITTYLSHSVWASQQAFAAWTESEAFRKAHGDARSPQGTLAGHPVFEGFEVIL
jgi:heme-degrading monooxygenase HmoA